MARPKGPPHHSTHIRIPVNVWNWFVKLAEKDETTVKHLIVAAMKDYANKREKERLEKLKNGIPEVT